MLIAYDHINVTSSHRTSHRFFKVTAIHRPHTVPRLLYSIQRYTAIQRYTLYSYTALYTIHAIHHPSGVLTVDSTMYVRLRVTRVLL